MINLKTAAGLLLFFCLVSNVSAFGAGDIGELSNQAGRAFRHGASAFDVPRKGTRLSLSNIAYNR